MRNNRRETLPTAVSVTLYERNCNLVAQNSGDTGKLVAQNGGDTGKLVVPNSGDAGKFVAQEPVLCVSVFICEIIFFPLVLPSINRGVQ